MILVNKTRQTLQVLKHNGRLQIIEEYPCATGENPGTKSVSGDACTPEGVYFITKIYKDNKISIFGKRAFHLDYPNIFDALNGRNGNGIYIHGTNKKLIPFSTNGCITMRNIDLDHLVKYLDRQATPVVIVQDMEQLQHQPAESLAAQDFRLAKSLLPPPDVDQNAIYFDNLYSIRFGTQAVVVGDFVHQKHEHARNRGNSRVYLDFSNEHGWQTRKRLWHITQSVIFPDNPFKLLAHKPITEEVFIPPQTTTAIAQAKSKQLLAQIEITKELEPIQSVEPNTRKKSPSKKLKVNQIAVVEPHSETLPAAKKTQASSLTNQKAVRKKIKPQKHSQSLETEKKKQTVLDFIETWRQAWQGKDLDSYISAYDATFRQGNKDVKAWRRYKEYLNQNYKTIKIDISDISIRWTPAGATVSFQQIYKSDKYHAVGRKTLLLVPNNKGWAIHRELWSRNST